MDQDIPEWAGFARVFFLVDLALLTPYHKGIGSHIPTEAATMYSSWPRA